MTGASRILFAHERPPIARSVERVLTAHGFSVESVVDGDAALARIEKGGIDGLAVDVALPGLPGYELTARAREHGVRAVILVASVYRRTSYKRRPTRLYGADDYVEVHHLGDQLPDKLREHLGMPSVSAQGSLSDMVADELKDEGDARMESGDPARLASLIVADMILYNGEVIADAVDTDTAEKAVSEDLKGARELFAQFQERRGQEVVGDPVGEAFRDLMTHIHPNGGSGHES